MNKKYYVCASFDKDGNVIWNRTYNHTFKAMLALFTWNRKNNGVKMSDKLLGFEGEKYYKTYKGTNGYFTIHKYVVVK